MSVRVTERGQTATDLLIQEGFIVYFHPELFQQFPQCVVNTDADSESILEAGHTLVLLGKLTPDEALAYVARTAPEYVDKAALLMADGLIPYRAVAE